MGPLWVGDVKKDYFDLFRVWLKGWSNMEVILVIQFQLNEITGQAFRFQNP